MHFVWFWFGKRLVFLLTYILSIGQQTILFLQNKELL